jgi:hypothetical protein
MPGTKRKCKYGERLSNGKCPKKPTKKRPCKYGERLANGKCPKKTKSHKTKKILSYTTTPESVVRKREKYRYGNLFSTSSSKKIDTNIHNSKDNKTNMYLITIHNLKGQITNADFELDDPLEFIEQLEKITKTDVSNLDDLHLEDYIQLMKYAHSDIDNEEFASVWMTACDSELPKTKSIKHGNKVYTIKFHKI